MQLERPAHCPVLDKYKATCAVDCDLSVSPKDYKVGPSRWSLSHQGAPLGRDLKSLVGLLSQGV